jgi:phosphoribosylanthranilate isomerase
MKYPDNILEVSSLLPDYMGFIFWEKSSRYFGIIPTLPGSIKKVGVLLMKHYYYYQKVLKHDLQVVQLHGKNQWTFVKNCEANCQKVLKL